MISLNLLLNMVYFFIIFSLITYLDLKFRRIPNKVFKLVFSISLIFNMTESFLYLNNYFIFILSKFFFLF